MRDPLVTVWPAFTGAMYLLGTSWRGQKALWSRVETGALALATLDEGDAPRMRELMEKYRDLDRDGAIQTGVAGFVDLAHTARADLRGHFVDAEAGPAARYPAGSTKRW